MKLRDVVPESRVVVLTTGKPGHGWTTRVWRINGAGGIDGIVAEFWMAGLAESGRKHAEVVSMARRGDYAERRRMAVAS